MSLINIIEFAIIALTSCAIITTLIPSLGTKAALSVLLLASALIIIQLVGFHFRWQMIPAYIVFITLLIAIIVGFQVGIIVKINLIISAILCLSTSLILSMGLPVLNLPEPKGGYKVGMTSLEHNYAASNETDNKRRLNVTIWYPTDLQNEANHKYASLWNDIHNKDEFSTLERFFAHYLKNIKTNSVQNALLAPSSSPRQVIVYNHALLSTATENTLLMETLASHGYIVLSLHHKDQRAEYIELNTAMSKEDKEKEKKDLLKLGSDMNRTERAAFAGTVYQSNAKLTEIVKRRTADSKHIVDNLSDILAEIPNCNPENCIETNNVSFIGMSLGGAVATQVCQNDDRCNSVINLDGGVFGGNTSEQITKPYLMIYSPSHAGGNDYLRDNVLKQYSEKIIAGANHANFHDANFVLPILRWFGILGSIDAKEMLELKDQYVLEFLKKTKFETQ